MTMEKGTVNSSGEGERRTPRLPLCVWAFPRSSSSLLLWLFPSSSTEGSSHRVAAGQAPDCREKPSAKELVGTQQAAELPIASRAVPGGRSGSGAVLTAEGPAELQAAPLPVRTQRSRVGRSRGVCLCSGCMVEGWATQSACPAS